MANEVFKHAMIPPEQMNIRKFQELQELFRAGAAQRNSDTTLPKVTSHKEYLDSLVGLHRDAIEALETIKALDVMADALKNEGARRIVHLVIRSGLEALAKQKVGDL